MTNWQGRRVVIIGAARQGLALARYLAGHEAEVVLNDQRNTDAMGKAQTDLKDTAVEWVLGEHPVSILEGADLVCVSGGVPLNLPLVEQARSRGIPLSNDSQIFLEAAPCPVVGITGSAGKTTTTTLVGRMASAGCELQKEENEALEEEHFARELQNLDIVKCQPSSHVWVGGNIGSPLISVVDRMMPQDVAVMELSSFQLELMDRSPQLAAVLNITPNHLDRHGTMQAYTAAKARILAFQASQDVAVLGRDDPGAWSLVEKFRGRLLTFGLSGLLEGQDGTFIQEEAIWLRLAGQAVRVMPLESIQLRGEHNRLNVLAACAIAAGMGLPPQAMRKGVEEFSGVAHRLEFVRIWGGAAWYNDSIATAPERAMAAIRSFDEPLILLAGGRDKDLPWGAFAELVVQRVERLVLFGEAAEKILQAVQAAAQGAGSGPEISLSPDLHQAVLEAAKAVRPGYAVLLSPGGTSFDEFRDFEERGVCFAQWVKELP